MDPLALEPADAGAPWVRPDSFNLNAGDPAWTTYDNPHAVDSPTAPDHTFIPGRRLSAADDAPSGVVVVPGGPARRRLGGDGAATRDERERTRCRRRC